MERHGINPVLLDYADWRLAGDHEKAAFVPGGAADPAAAGGMPMDPAMAGGAMPPMDPMAAGGAPPMDPAMAGGAPPMDPMAMAGAPPAAAPAAAPANGAPGAGGKPKIDPTFIYMELSRVRKLLTHMLQQTGIDLPPDILDDGSVAQVMQGQQPNSNPIGQEPQTAAPAPAPGAEASLPALGGEGPVSPISAPGEKAGALQMFRAPTGDPDFRAANSRVDAISMLSRGLAQQ